MPISQPTFIPLVWASDANADKNTIPTTMATPTDNAAASWTMGFPTETSDPIAAGGVYVSRKDFNGAFNAITGHISFNNRDRCIRGVIRLITILEQQCLVLMGKNIGALPLMAFQALYRIL